MLLVKYAKNKINLGFKILIFVFRDRFFYSNPFLGIDTNEIINFKLIVYFNSGYLNNYGYF